MFKKFFQKAYFDFKSKEFIVINDFLAFFTVLSIISIVLETVPGLVQYRAIFDFIEYFTVVIFVIEYLSRAYVAKNKLKYVFSFFGIIDFLAIVPTIFTVGNFTFIKSVRVLRILRFLRMMRLAKILRFKKEKNKDLEEYGKIYSMNFQIYFMALFSAIIIFGSLIYVIEGNSFIESIPMGMLWSTKVILGGIPSASPPSVLGEIISIFARFTGLILFGLLINVVGVFVKKLLFGGEININKDV